MNSVDASKLGQAIGNKTAPKVIRRAGDLNSVEVNGQVFSKMEKIYIPNIGLVRTVDYGNHFVFRDARQPWTLVCTCGGPAAVLGFDALKYGQSDENGSFVACMCHAGAMAREDGSFPQGRHADGSM